MPNNDGLAQRIADVAYNSTVKETIIEIDLGEIADALKEFPKLQVCVNVPGIWDKVIRQVRDPDDLPRDQAIAVLSICTGMNADAISQWGDPVMYVLLRRVIDEYFLAWDKIRKNSKAQ